MGSKESSFKKEIEIGEEIAKQSQIYRIWTEVYPCLHSKKFRRTLFSRQFLNETENDAKLFIENGIKFLRQLRHPKILRYFDSSLDVDEISLLTERVHVLDLAIDSQSPIEIHSGICDMLSALTFLHEKAGIYHNNVCSSSVFVTMDGRWKLGGFECAQRKNTNQHWLQNDFVRSIKFAECIPPEDQQVLDAAETPLYARDVYAFGKLIEYALPFMKDHLDNETVSSLESVIELSVANSSCRLDLGALASSNPVAFSNELSTIIDFLYNIPEKTSSQKKAFFSTLINDLKNIPEYVIARRLVPLLLSRYVILDEYAHSYLLTVILQPSGIEGGVHEGLLSEYLYRNTVIPEIIKIFRVHETSVRLALLAYFNLYMWYFNVSQLEIVLEELKLGLQDVDERIVSASMHAMADMVLVLGGRQVTGVTQKKIFANGTPKKDSSSLPTNTLNRIVFGRKSIDQQSPRLMLSEDRTINFDPVESNSSVNTAVVTKDSPFIDNPVDHGWSSDWSDSIDIDDNGILFVEEKSVISNEIVHNGVDFKKSNNDACPESLSDDPIQLPLEEAIETDYFVGMEPVIKSAEVYVPDSETLDLEPGKDRIDLQAQE